MNTSAIYDEPSFGQPLMRDRLKRERSMGYTKHSVLGDILDEGMLHCKKSDGKVLIVFKEGSTDSKLKAIEISDNIEGGIKGIDEEGMKNPLSYLHHESNRHNNDEEWSQWGSGLTSASMCCGDIWEIYTRYEKKEGDYAYAYIKYDWEEMARKNKETPEFKDIDEVEYRKNHQWKRGSTFKYSHCRSELFSGGFSANVRNIVTMISRKYNKCLKETEDGHTVTYQCMNQENNDAPAPIEADIPPTNRGDTHPHPIYILPIEVRTNDEDEEIVIFKDKVKNKWFQQDGITVHSRSKWKSITYADIAQSYPILIDTLDFRGTDTHGIEGYNSKGRFPNASLVMERYGRTLTEDCRTGGGGRWMGFTKYHHSKRYHYLHLSYLSKKISKNFGDTCRKTIECDLGHYNTPLNRVLREVERRLNNKIGKGKGGGSAKRFEEEWKENYGVEWKDGETYKDNLERGEKMLQHEQERAETAVDTAAAVVNVHEEVVSNHPEDYEQEMKEDWDAKRQKIIAYFQAMEDATAVTYPKHFCLVYKLCEAGKL